MERFNLNQFLQNIKFKNLYINKLKAELADLNLIQNANVDNSNKMNNNLIVSHIVNITFSRTNTLINFMDFSGKLIFYYSAGKVRCTGKSKKVRKLVLKALFQRLFLRLDHLDLANHPIALHLKNVGYNTSWIIKRLKKKLFITVIKIYAPTVYNGCRKRKLIKKRRLNDF